MIDLKSKIAAAAEQEGLLDVAYTTLDTPIGTLLLAATRRGLVRIVLPDQDEEEALTELATAVSPRVLQWPARLDEARRELEQYFEGRRRRFELDLDHRLRHAGFQRQVLRAIERIPFGSTLSYAQVAGRAGNARACRAAGSALGRNPIPIVVPCHRVLRSSGAVGEYGGGPEMKRYLLELEGAI